MPSRFPWEAMLLGLSSTVLIVLGGTLAGAGVPGGGGRLWLVPAIPMRPSVDLLGALFVFYAGLILLVRSWLRLRRDVRRRGATVAAVSFGRGVG